MSALPGPGGSRRAVRQRSAAVPDRGTAVAALLAAVAVAAVLLVGPAEPETESTAGQASAAPVVDALWACPATGTPGGIDSRMTVGSAPLPGLGDGGEVRVGDIATPAVERSTQELGRGALATVGNTGRGAAPVVSAQGEVAAGLFVHQVDTHQDNRTVAVAHCPSPASSWWFTGAGATLDHSSELVLANADPGPAVVNVRVFGPDGPVETVGTRGLTVAPGERTVLRLTEIAPQGEELAVNVETSRGRVVAAMADSYAAGAGAPRGTEWIPAEHTAHRTVRLAGLPTRAESRSLLIANPSEREALVDLEVAGPTGGFTPAEGSQVRVPPGLVVSTDVSAIVGREDAAVRLTAEVPVVATVRSVRDNDVTYAASVRPLPGPAAVPLVGDPKLLLSATTKPATASVATFDRSGNQVESAEVRIVPGGTSGWVPQESAAYAVVSPSGGRVFGAVAVAGEPGLSQVPLTPLVVERNRPVVRPGLR